MTTAGAIRPFPVSDTIGRIWAEIERLDLVRNVAELEALGFTVIPPEKVAPPEVIAELRAKVLDVAERRTGDRPPPAARRSTPGRGNWAANIRTRSACPCPTSCSMIPPSSKR